MGAILPIPDDNFPYEKLTDEQTANVQRLRDRQMRKLRQENHQLKDELYKLQQVITILDIDPDVIIATDKALKGKRPWQTPTTGMSHTP